VISNTHLEKVSKHSPVSNGSSNILHIRRPLNSVTTTCPAIFFCAPASGQGKTTITAGIARYHKNQGKDVRAFKIGPDYIDPMILEQASGNPVVQLDLWMVGEEACKHFLFKAAREADLILIEGSMGMFDGDPSSVDMAQYFGIPIVIVINTRSMAQTFGAVAYGLATYRSSLEITGVIANALGSQRHIDLITDSMPEDLQLLGCIKNTPQMRLPERHLGLVHPNEVEDIDARIDNIADVILKSGLAAMPNPITFSDGNVDQPLLLLEGIRIGIAKDDAFTFIYAANVDLLEKMGAVCSYFSPLIDHEIPDVDALWFPGGYPELYHKKLSANEGMKSLLRAFHEKGGRILAECGGMLYLMNSLTDIHNEKADMVGLLPGDGIMRERGGCQGMQYAPFPHGEFRAHAHHRTRCENTLDPVAYGRRLRHTAIGEPIFQKNGISASYLHLYFPSNPQAIAGLFLGTYL